jgi:hypothetical protein
MYFILIVMFMYFILMVMFMYFILIAIFMYFILIAIFMYFILIVIFMYFILIVMFMYFILIVYVYYSYFDVYESLFLLLYLCILFYCYVYVFLLTCMLCSAYSLPTDILRLPWLRFSCASISVLRQMPEYTSQRRGTTRPLPNWWIVSFYVLFVCTFVLYYCHRLSTLLQLTNIYEKKNKVLVDICPPRPYFSHFSLIPLGEKLVLNNAVSSEIYSCHEIRCRMFRLLTRL